MSTEEVPGSIARAGHLARASQHASTKLNRVMQQMSMRWRDWQHGLAQNRAATAPKSNVASFVVSLAPSPLVLQHIVELHGYASHSHDRIASHAAAAKTRKCQLFAQPGSPLWQQHPQVDATTGALHKLSNERKLGECANLTNAFRPLLRSPRVEVQRRRRLFATLRTAASAWRVASGRRVTAVPAP